MSAPGPVPPRTDPVQLPELEPAGPEDLAGLSLDLDAVHVDGVTVERLDLGHSGRLESSRLDRLRAGRLEVPGATFVECVLTDTDVPVLAASASVWRDVEVTGGRWGSAEFAGAQWRGVHLRGVRISYLNLRGADLQDVRLTDCRVDELDLGDATVRRMDLPGTRVDRLALDHARLADVDLRGLDPQVLDGLDGLRGATVSEDQVLRWAPAFAGHLGLSIRD